MRAKLETYGEARAIIIATLMPPHGSTGVQTHVNVVRTVLTRRNVEARVITPFSITSAAVYPLFGVRKVIDTVSKTASVWWYRYWHYQCLKLALARVLKTTGEVVVYAQCPLSAEAALTSRTGAHQEVVMAVHYNVSQADEWVGKGYLRPVDYLYRSIQKLERNVLPRLDGIVFVSEFMKNVIKTNNPAVAKVSSVVVPNFVLAPDSRGSGRRTADIISIGTLEPRKNQGYLIKVLAEAKHQGKLYSLTLVGGGPERVALEHMAKSLGVEKQVRFAGFQSSAAELLGTHRVYAHSALMENLPLSLIEAMAHGLPVLAAPVGGIPEVFDDGREGYYWSLDDPKSGAQKLMALLEDPVLYQDMAKACLKCFMERFDATVGGERLLSFLHVR